MTTINPDRQKYWQSLLDEAEQTASGEEAKNETD